MASRQRSFHPPGVTFHRDVSAGLWVQEGFGPRFKHIESLLPRGFEAYARIFHPARALDDHPVRWSDVAAWSGRTAHPLMAFERISVPTPESELTDRGPAPWHDDPAFGRLDDDQATVLADFLRGFTSTPESCFFGVWEGYGQFHSGGRAYFYKSGKSGSMKLDPPADIGKAQRIESVLHLKYLLYSGPLSTVMAFIDHWSHSPNLWWPEDRRWCVATDIDLPSSYIGCDARCLEALLRHASLEASPIDYDAPVHMAADELNGPHEL